MGALPASYSEAFCVPALDPCAECHVDGVERLELTRMKKTTLTTPALSAQIRFDGVIPAVAKCLWTSVLKVYEYMGRREALQKEGRKLSNSTTETGENDQGEDV